MKCFILISCALIRFLSRFSCKSETLSTLRFAQRAKAIQNKAVVNEEKANDVNLLREQIRQLKVTLRYRRCHDRRTYVSLFTTILLLVNWYLKTGFPCDFDTG